MSAADALAKAGLKPIQPFAADSNALTSSDAYATAASPHSPWRTAIRRSSGPT